MTFNRFSSSMSNGGFAGSDAGNTPLDNDTLRAMVPALFAETAHESRSDRFVPIPTMKLVDGLRKEGFVPFFAQQAKTRDSSRRDFAKHLIRMRHESLANTKGEAFEIILNNANDGSSSYNMLPGFFRFVCMNGLFVGDVFKNIRIRHTGADTLSDVIEGAYTVLEDAPRVCEQVQAFKDLNLSSDESQAFADAAHMVRFPEAYEVDTEDESARPELIEGKAPITARALLTARRTEDRAADLWTVFNRVQENAVRGGQRGYIRGADGRARRAKVRPVKGIDQNSTLNRALWTLADNMAMLKGVAA